jgi:hypothetical protein
VRNVPFSAEAITMVREALPAGSVREHSLTAHYYRDSRGRVRAELDNPYGQFVVLWMPGAENSGFGTFYVVDSAKRTYRLAGYMIAAHMFNGEGGFVLPLGKVRFRRACQVAGESPAERLQAVNAQMSADLGIVIASHRSDNIGSVDYKLTNIRRDEPPAELFDVPTDYTFVRGSKDDPIVTFEPWSRERSCMGRTR